MKYRLINCEFVSSSAFRRALSNKAQLLYYWLLVNTDDRGFVGNAKELTDALKITDTSNEILNGYDIALAELEMQGYIYLFKDNHNNQKSRFHPEPAFFEYNRRINLQISPQLL